MTLNEIAGVNLAKFEVDTNTDFRNFFDVEEAMQPISYEVNENEINVRIANQSPVSLQLADGRLVILSDGGIRIRTEFVNYFPDELLVLPGAELTISYPNTYKGQSTNARVMLNYDFVE